MEHILDQSSLAIWTYDLQRSFGQTAAVAGLNLSVARGEMFGLVGPDGAGKSTAIRLLCGLLKATGGEGRILGFDLAREAEKIKARIGYLSQAFTLYGDLTIDENIEFFAELHGVGDFQRRRNELLDFLRLTPFRRRMGQALSGGMKKKLALACTLIHTPDILFLDEPSTGVDPISRGDFWNILSAILEQGVTICMTTPYLDEAERCHRIGLMHSGRIIHAGTPAAIKAALPGRMYRIVAPDLGAAYRTLRLRWPPEQVVRYGDRLHFWARDGESELARATDWLNRQSIPHAQIAAIAPALEDIFVAWKGSTATLQGGNP
jgi:ABC-2 type transport system ATP-binding protein